MQAPEKTLNAIFPQPEEQTKLERAKAILGDLSKSYSDEKLENLVSDFEYLAESWLDLFEKESFEGMTLRELLKLA